MIVVTAAEMRRLDELTIQRYGTPGRVLMERAGLGAAAVLRRRFPQVRRRRVVICAGKGNNGGDGFVMARALRGGGVRVEVVLLGTQSEVKGDAALALAALRRTRQVVSEATSAAAVGQLPKRFAGAALIVDAVFGTGLNAPVDGRLADVLRTMNNSGVPIFAVDIPSGLDADRGLPLGVAVSASATATFGFAKIGQVVHPGRNYVGDLSVVDIGIAPQAVAEVRPRTELLDAASAGRLVPVRPPDAHKGSCGHVLIFAGSHGRTGAALLGAHAACRAGAGLTTLAGPVSLNAILASGPPEVMTAALADRDGQMEFDEGHVRQLLEGKNAVVVGPGLGTHDAAGTLVRFLLREIDLPLVLDADALTCVARDPTMLPATHAGVVLTPHPGEMARLLGSDTGSVQGDRLGIARRFVQQGQCVLVLKGVSTVIAAADGRAWINPTGNPGMASGGMGDALTGMIGALLAQGLAPPDAACLAVYAHGAAADAAVAVRGPIGILASDVIDAFPATLARLRADSATEP